MKEIIILFFVFYLYNIISQNKTISHQMTNIMSNNRLFQHVMTFIMLFVLLSLNKKTSLTNDIMISVFLYILYVLSTKLDLHWTLLMLALLFGAYIYYTYNDLDYDDKNIDEYIKKQHSHKQELYKKYIIGAIIIIVISGTLFYNNRKIQQYGGNYDFYKYIVC